MGFDGKLLIEMNDKLSGSSIKEKLKDLFDQEDVRFYTTENSPKKESFKHFAIK